MSTTINRPATAPHTGPAEAPSTSRPSDSIPRTMPLTLPIPTTASPDEVETVPINVKELNSDAPKTPIATSPEVDENDVPRRIGALRISDVLSIIGAVIASLAMTSIIYSFFAPVGGPIGFFATMYILFLATYALLVSLDEALPTVRARVISVAVHSLAVTVFVTLVFVVLFATFRGLEALPHWNFFTQDMALAGPLDPLTVGGIVHAIAGTLIQITIALAITIPLGLTTAIFLNEIPGAFSRFVRTIVEAMTALPSIVAGLFIYATFILMLGIGKSGFAASLAISVMMLPIMIRASDVVLRLVPHTLKEASLGLGANNWHTMWHVTLPTARSGLVTAIILATARGIGETSPVLLTSGFTAALNLNPFNGPMVSLPLAVFQFVKSPEPTMIARGFGTAAVLMALVVTLFIIARVIGNQTVAKRERARERRQKFFGDTALFFTTMTKKVLSAYIKAATSVSSRITKGGAAISKPNSMTAKPDSVTAKTSQASASHDSSLQTSSQASSSPKSDSASARRQARAKLAEHERRLDAAMGRKDKNSKSVSFEEYLEMFPETNPAGEKSTSSKESPAPQASKPAASRKRTTKKKPTDQENTES